MNNETKVEGLLSEPSRYLRKRPRGRPIKHGVYSKFVLVKLTDEWRGKVVAALRAEGLEETVGDTFLIDMLARLLAQIELISKYLSEHGYFLDDATGDKRGTISPLVQEMRHTIRLASILCNQLGLSPTTRQRLKAPQKEDFASQIQKARGE